MIGKLRRRQKNGRQKYDDFGQVGGEYICDWFLEIMKSTPREGPIAVGETTAEIFTCTK
jgi:hypothetical protein